ncbi:MAG: GNAT family N-acetyltransferase [Pseudomonadota bacterium]
MSLPLGLIIRPITVGDTAAFGDAVGAVAAERRWIAMTEPPEAASVRGFIEAQLSAGNPHLVATFGDTLVGWCDITADTRPPLAHTGRLGMGVRAEWRGRGIGRALLGAALAAADRRGLARVELDVNAGNAAAVGLYESAGFVREGIRRGAWRLNGAEQDVLLLARLTVTAGRPQAIAPKIRPAASEPTSAKPR